MYLKEGRYKQHNKKMNKATSWGRSHTYEELVDDKTANPNLRHLAKEFLSLQERRALLEKQRCKHLEDHFAAKKRAEEIFLNDSGGFHTFGRPAYIQAKDIQNRQAGLANECYELIQILDIRLKGINQEITNKYT